MCKILIGANPLRDRFNKGDVFKRAYDGTRHLILFELEKNVTVVSIGLDIA